MCKLEKEVSTWKQRWEGSHRALLEMAEEKQKADRDLNHANRQLIALQKLCRTLQGERSNLLSKLKETSPSGMMFYTYFLHYCYLQKSLVMIKCV